MSIKTKLILGISILFLVVFATVFYIFIGEKRQELTRDMFFEARSFAELSTPKIVDLYETYLAERGFVIFNREIGDLFRKDEDIASIRIATFAGEILYDSIEEENEQWSGPQRAVADTELLARVKAVNPSVQTADGRTVYFKKTTDGELHAVDGNEQRIADIGKNERAINIVQPHQNEFAVIYGLTYEFLNARIAATTARLVYLFVFSLLLGLFFGYFVATKITGPIKKLTNSALVLATGDFKERVHVKTRDEVGVLAQTFNKMAEDLERSTKAMIYKERVEKELEIAAKIQKEILPKEMPKTPGLDIAAGLIPAAEIGGDCYDFIHLGGDRYLFYIGDVTGHGVPSGIVVAIANALIYSFGGLENLEEIARSVNRVLKDKTSANMFMTLLMAKWDGNTLEYVSAGHEQMIQFHKRQAKVSVVPGGGIALGMVPDIEKTVKKQTVALESGDVLVLYSDGLPEAWSVNNEMYGPARLKRAVGEYAELPSAEAIRNAILADIQEFARGAEQKDDMTLLVLKRS